MHSEFDLLLDELDACREAREASNDEQVIHKSHLAPVTRYAGHRSPSGEVIETMRREWPEQRAPRPRPRVSLDRALADLGRINKSMVAAAEAERSAARTEQLALLRGEYAKARNQIDALARSGRMEALEVAKLETRLNRIGPRLASFESSGAAA